MQITEISVEIGRTSSVNYQSTRNAIGLKATLTPGEDPELETRRLQKKALKLLLGNVDDGGCTYDEQSVSNEINQLILEQGFPSKDENTPEFTLKDADN